MTERATPPTGGIVTGEEVTGLGTDGARRKCEVAKINSTEAVELLHVRFHQQEKERYL